MIVTIVSEVVLIYFAYFHQTLGFSISVCILVLVEQLNFHVMCESTSKLIEKLNKRIFNNILDLEFIEFDSKINIPDLLFVLSKDIDKIENITNIVISIGKEVFIVLTYVAFFVFNNLWQALPLFCLLTYFYFEFTNLITVLFEIKKLKNKNLESIYQKINNYGKVIELIKIYEGQNFVFHAILRRFNKFYGCRLAEYGVLSYITLRIKFVLLFVFFVMILIFKWTNQKSFFALQILFMFNLNNRIRFSVKKIEKYLERLFSFHRLDFFLNIQRDRQLADTIKRIESGKIELVNYSSENQFDNNMSLKDVTLNIDHAEKVSIIGKNGSGKSKVCLAVISMVNCKFGILKIDNNLIELIDKESLREQIVVIPQEEFIFKGSIRENIDPWLKVEEQQIKRLLDRIGFYEVSKHKHMNIQLEKGGKSISKGERQLLLIARGLLRVLQNPNVKILILDHPDSALGEEIRAKVEEYIDHIVKDKTLIRVGQEKMLKLVCDKVVTFDKGKIVDVKEKVKPDQSVKFMTIETEE